MKKILSVNGTFQPSKKLTVAANAAGQITRLRFEDGSYVKRKQELLRVDNTLLRNELKMTIQSMEKAKKDYDRMKNLLKDGGVTAVQVEDAAYYSEYSYYSFSGLFNRKTSCS